MIDGSEKRNRQLTFELQNSHVSEKRSKPEKLQSHSNEGKGKAKKKVRGEGKEEKKKSNGRNLSFYTSHYGDSF